MSSSILAVAQVGSLLSYRESRTGKVPLLQALYSNTKHQAERHKPLNRQNNPKRCQVSPSGQGDRKRRDPGISADGRDATIKSLKDQVSCLKKLLQQAYTPQRKTSAKHSCPAISCGKPFTSLEHLYRHIRDLRDFTHQPLAYFINETHCSICSRTCCRPCDLVKHEKGVHHESYVSRLDKFLGTSAPLSPLPGSSITVNGLSSR